MNIFIYLKEFPLNKETPFSGPMKVVDGFSMGLAHHQAQVTVLCEGETDVVVETGAFRIRRFANRNPRRPFHVAPGLKDFIKRETGDGLVILNGLFNPPLTILGRWLRQNSIPYVVSPHDEYHPSLFQKNPQMKWPYWYLFERPLLRRAAAIQVLDQRHQDWLPGLGVQNKVFEVPNGFEPEIVPPAETLRWTKTGPVRFISLGRLDAHHKGLDLLIEAFSRVAATSDAMLTLQGPDWGDREKLERQAQALGLSGRITFAPPDYNRTSCAIFAGHDAVCMPSRFDGFGLSALEGMLTGRPLLVSGTAGIAPHVKRSESGVIVQPEVGSIAQGLEELVRRRDEWETMGRSGRAYVLKELSWDGIAAGALRHYQALVQTANAPPVLA